MCASEMERMDVAICVRHEQVIRNTTPYTVCGKPHVYYGLKALRESGVAQRLLFYSGSEVERAVAEELGYTVLHLEERDWSRVQFSPCLSREVALALGMAPDDPNPLSFVIPRMRSIIRMDCNLVLLRSETIRKLHRLSRQGREKVYGASPLAHGVMLGLEDEKMFTLLEDWTQIYYRKEHKPNVNCFFMELRVESPEYVVPGALGMHYMILPESERLYLNGPSDAVLADAYLSKFPEHFDVQE